MTDVAFLDLAAITRRDRDALLEACARVVDSGWFVGGAELAAFEAAFATACGVEHAVGTGNGLDALVLGLRALGVGPGDEVVVPSHTFIASWLAVTQTGATPVPADVHPGTANLDAARVAEVVGPRTAAVLPVHLYGQPADWDALEAVAGRHGLALVEDAAQAQGARWRGRPAGGLGRLAGFSFYPGKNLGALGDAGAVTTADGDLAARVRRLGNYGSRRKYHHDDAGVNSRLDELQAAFLSIKLARLAADNDRRRAIAARYLQALAGTPGLGLPEVAEGAEPVWHLFVVRHARRDELAAALRERGVQTLIHYPIAAHRSGAYAGLDVDPDQVRVAERLADEVLSLPMGPHLGDAQVGAVCEAVAEAAAVLQP